MYVVAEDLGGAVNKALARLGYEERIAHSVTSEDRSFATTCILHAEEESSRVYFHVRFVESGVRISPTRTSLPIGSAQTLLQAYFRNLGPYTPALSYITYFAVHNPLLA